MQCFFFCTEGAKEETITTAELLNEAAMFEWSMYKNDLTGCHKKLKDVKIKLTIRINK